MLIELYKYNIDTDKIQVYKLEGREPTFTATFGQQGGKMQTSIIKANTDKKVATVIRNKRKKGYYDTIVEARNEAEYLLRSRVMKIGNYDTCKGNLKYPVLATVKLDGVAGHTTDNVRNVYSRDNNFLFKSEVDLLPWAQFEIYKEDTPLADIIHLIHNAPERLSIRYHDLKLPDKTYVERMTILFRATPNAIPIMQLDSEEDLDAFYEGVVKLGAEGIVVHNADEKYRGGSRSTNSMKRKPVNSKEFEVVDVLEEIDKNTGMIMAVFQFKDFKARPKGTKESRRDIYDSKDDWIGRPVTVEYRGLTKYGIPQHPVAIPIVRDYE